MNGKITNNFYWQELLQTETGLENKIIDPSHISNMVCTTMQLQSIRESLQTPFYITSGYRSEAVNSAVGGSLTSNHLRGEAIDFTISDVSLLPELYQIIEESHIFDELYYYSKQNFIHFAFKRLGRNRQKSVIR